MRCGARISTSTSCVLSQWSARLCLSQYSAISSIDPAFEMPVRWLASFSLILLSFPAIHVSRTENQSCIVALVDKEDDQITSAVCLATGRIDSLHLIEIPT